MVVGGARRQRSQSRQQRRSQGRSQRRTQKRSQRGGFIRAGTRTN